MNLTIPIIGSKYKLYIPGEKNFSSGKNILGRIANKGLKLYCIRDDAKRLIRYSYEPEELTPEGFVAVRFNGKLINIDKKLRSVA